MESHPTPNESTPTAPLGTPIDSDDIHPEPLGLPPIPAPSEPVDAEVYAAWKQHMVDGYAHNSLMFRQVLDAFMRPYWITVRLYQIMFAVGVGGFVLAAVLGAWLGLEFSLVFGGISVFSFLAYFISQPLRSLEQNIQFITWLGIIYNTYWTRLMYANNVETVQQDLEDITKASIYLITQMMDKHAEMTGKRPGVKIEETRVNSGE